MDALSEALRSVRVTAAIFYDAVCTKPWAFPIPPLAEYAHLLAPGAERLVSYHLITEGRRHVRDHFSWDSIAGQFDDLYGSLMTQTSEAGKVLR